MPLEYFFDGFFFHLFANENNVADPLFVGFPGWSIGKDKTASDRLYDNPGWGVIYRDNPLNPVDLMVVILLCRCVPVGITGLIRAVRSS